MTEIEKAGRLHVQCIHGYYVTTWTQIPNTDQYLFGGYDGRVTHAGVVELVQNRWEIRIEAAIAR